MDNNAAPAPSPQPQTPAALAADAPVTHAGWLTRNLMTVVLVAIAAGGIAYWLKTVDDPVEWLVTVSKVVVALGLVIFIHELGHFVAAKWCDVHVETFSLGFFGTLFGILRFQWGETTYKIGWVPLGGYVKMLGEGDDNEEAAEDPRAYKNKKVWQRMIIISAGVTMNLFLAWVCYVLVYMTHGIDQVPGVVGNVGPGGPAWKKGLQPGDRIDRIGGKQNPFYEELQREVYRNGKNHAMPLAYTRYNQGAAKQVQTEITPARSDEIFVPMLLVRAAKRPVLIRKAGKVPGPYNPDTPAAKASPSFQFGDQIIAATDPDHDSRVTPLRPDPRFPGAGLDFYDLERRLQFSLGKDVTIRVKRSADGSEADITVGPAFARTIGMRLQMGQIVALREDSPAAKAGLRPREGKERGDVIQAVEVNDKSGMRRRYSAVKNDGEPLDPVKLPTQLALWAAEKPDDYTVTITVMHPAGHETVEKTVKLTWDKDWDLFDKAPWTPESPLTIAPLGLAYQVGTTVAEVEDDSPAKKAGLAERDVISDIEFRVESPSGKSDTIKREVKENEGAYYFSFLHEFSVHDLGWITEVVLTIKGKEQKITVTPRTDPTWPLTERGLIFDDERQLQKADGFLQAMRLSAERLVIKVETIYENLLGMIVGRISIKGVAGPISIAKYAFDLAGQDTFEFILFIALININLAVVNFLPIPVLDGGHMVFLGYELLRGKPPSERWRFILTIMGLIVVLGLMFLGLLLDFNRWMLEPLKNWLGL